MPCTPSAASLSSAPQGDSHWSQTAGGQCVRPPFMAMGTRDATVQAALVRCIAQRAGWERVLSAQTLRVGSTPVSCEGSGSVVSLVERGGAAWCEHCGQFDSVWMSSV